VRRIRLLVSGRVQGVCFRAYTRNRAEELGVSGHVRNLPDGRVEIEAQGEDADVEELVRWAEHGPPYACVSGTTLDECELKEDLEGFRVSY